MYNPRYNLISADIWEISPLTLEDFANFENLSLLISVKYTLHLNDLMLDGNEFGSICLSLILRHLTDFAGENSEKLL